MGFRICWFRMGMIVVALGLTLKPVPAAEETKEAPEWTFSATIIEACSCPR